MRSPLSDLVASRRQRLTLRPALRAKQQHEANLAEILLVELRLATPRDPRQVLTPRRAVRQDERPPSASRSSKDLGGRGAPAATAIAS